MMRALFVAAAAVAVAVADDFKWDCSEDGAQCGVVCCAPGYTLMGNDGGHWCMASRASDSDCQLCGSGDNRKDCSFEGDMYANLLDSNDKAVKKASTSSSLKPTTPSSGITLTLGTYNGMNGWHDIPASRFYNFRDFLIGITATVPSFYTAEGYKVVYSCESKGLLYGADDFKGCNIFFFVYRCPPCEARNGNIGQQLLQMEYPTWYALSCGPTFKLDKDNGFEHQFAVYMAEIADGDYVQVELYEHIEFMFWAMVGKSVICSTRATKNACDKAPDACDWNEHTEECRPKACPPLNPYKGWYGPLDKCRVCVDDETEYIPEVQFS